MAHNEVAYLPSSSDYEVRALSARLAHLGTKIKPQEGIEALAQAEGRFAVVTGDNSTSYWNPCKEESISPLGN